MFDRGSRSATPRRLMIEPCPPVVARLSRAQAVLLLAVAGDEVEDVGSLDVVELERLRHERLELADLDRVLELLLLLQRELFPRRDEHDIAVLAHVEALRLQDDVERLVPRDVLQAQREAALHRVARDDVEAGEVGDHLQHRAHFHVLEVERQLLALVAAARALHELVRVLEDRLDLEDEAVVGLVGRVLPQSLGLDHHARVAALLHGVDGDHRRAEVGHVEAALEVLGHRGLEEVDHQRASLLADVDAGGAVGEVDDEPALAVAAATEVDVAHGVLHLARLGLGKALHILRARLGDRLVVQRDQHRAALHPRVERLRTVEVEDDARAIARLDDVEAAQPRLVHGLDRGAEAVGRVEEVERDPRRARDGEGRRWIGRRALEVEAHHHAARACPGHGDVFEAVRALCGRDRRQQQGDDPEEHRAKDVALRPRVVFHSHGCSGAHHLRSCWFPPAGCKSSVLDRSAQSPAPSWISSFNLISPSPTFVITPKFCPR